MAFTYLKERWEAGAVGWSAIPLRKRVLRLGQVCCVAWRASVHSKPWKRVAVKGGDFLGVLVTVQDLVQAGADVFKVARSFCSVLDAAIHLVTEESNIFQRVVVGFLQPKFPEFRFELVVFEEQLFGDFHSSDEVLGGGAVLDVWSEVGPVAAAQVDFDFIHGLASVCLLHQLASLPVQWSWVSFSWRSRVFRQVSQRQALIPPAAPAWRYQRPEAALLHSGAQGGLAFILGISISVLRCSIGGIPSNRA